MAGRRDRKIVMLSFSLSLFPSSLLYSGLSVYDVID
jgi:hypothetical protein